MNRCSVLAVCVVAGCAKPDTHAADPPVPAPVAAAPIAAAPTPMKQVLIILPNRAARHPQQSLMVRSGRAPDQRDMASYDALQADLTNGGSLADSQRKAAYLIWTTKDAQLLNRMDSDYYRGQGMTTNTYLDPDQYGPYARKFRQSLLAFGMDMRCAIQAKRHNKIADMRGWLGAASNAAAAADENGADLTNWVQNREAWRQRINGWNDQMRQNMADQEASAAAVQQQINSGHYPGMP